MRRVGDGIYEVLRDEAVIGHVIRGDRQWSYQSTDGRSGGVTTTRATAVDTLTHRYPDTEAVA